MGAPVAASRHRNDPENARLPESVTDAGLDTDIRSFFDSVSQDWLI